VAPAALLALALAAHGGDPCVAIDERGRAFRVCFDRGNGLELSAGSARGALAPGGGGAADLRLRLRWRRDLRSPSGRLEWLRDMAFADGRALFTQGDPEPRAASVLAWRGVFVRHRASPFLLVPGPRPLRVPFPFDVGLLVEAGGAAWDRARPREAEVLPIRSALLLAVGGEGALRRLAFGPEVAWSLRVAEGQETLHRIVPFTAGVLDARLESRDGLHALAVTVRGGSSLAVPGGTEAFVEATLGLERVVLAVNDRPVAVYAEGAYRGGLGARGGEVGVGLRAGLGR
jgi:hypothetical protein